MNHVLCLTLVISSKFGNIIISLLLISADVMCYRPLSLRIKPRNFNPAGGQLLTSNVSCGHCPACQMTKKDEWTFRMFYEIDDCLNKGGVVVSQALTYSDLYVPYLSFFIPVVGEDNVMCFNRYHITKFLKLLRIRLERKGYVVSDRLRYFISSEYGSDPTKTRRPHYHGVFFSTCYHSVTKQPLSWVVLSSSIEECWRYGRSDGFVTISHERPYDWVNYFFDPLKPHVLLPDNKADYFKFSKISDYVSKYVVKDIEYEDTISKRCRNYLDSLYSTDTTTYKSLLRELKRNVKEFHVQSCGFGSSMLKYNSIEDIVKFGTIKKPSSDANKGLFVSIPIPLYYARKLFMELRKRQDNSLYWCYTTKGKEFLKERLFRKISNLELKYATLLEQNKKLSESVLPLLGKRSLHDLSLYICLYRGRVKPLHPIDADVPSPDIMIDNMCSVYDDLSNTYEISFQDGHYYVKDDVGNYKELYYFLNSDYSCYSQKDSPFQNFDDIYLHFASEIAILSQQKDKKDSQLLLFPNLFKNNYK